MNKTSITTLTIMLLVSAVSVSYGKSRSAIATQPFKTKEIVYFDIQSVNAEWTNLECKKALDTVEIKIHPELNYQEVNAPEILSVNGKMKLKNIQKTQEATLPNGETLLQWTSVMSYLVKNKWIQASTYSSGVHSPNSDQTQGVFQNNYCSGSFLASPRLSTDK